MGPLDHAFKQWLSELRRELHRHPETAYQEVWTTAKIKAVLDELGIENAGLDGLTGVVGSIPCAGPGKTIALRADIDALALQEVNDVPYKSLTDGRMHACGHDAHTTVMLGVARLLKAQGWDRRLKGNIKLLFQPAEEGGAGALKMIERGVLENPRVDWVIGGHVGPDTPAGSIGVYKTASHASADRFRLTVTGHGGHGGRPHQTVDPIVAAAHYVTALQTIVGRNVDPLEAGVVTVGTFQAGSADNIIPETAVVTGTIRAMTAKVRELILTRMEEMSQGLAATFRVETEIAIHDGYPPTINDETVSTFLAETAAALLGPDKVAYLNPTTGAEDFAYFAQERPSAIIRLGCGNKVRGLTAPLHSPHFDLDEDCLETGVRLFAAAVVNFLS
jgi:amidohydrolase